MDDSIRTGSAVDMTTPARISQADIQRAAKAARKAGWGSVRILVDLNQQRMEILMGDAVDHPVFTPFNWDASFKLLGPFLACIYQRLHAEVRMLGALELP